MAPAASTPGSAAARRTTSVQYRCCASSRSYRFPPSVTRAASTPPPSKPGRTRRISAKLRRRSPAPASSISESANWPTTSARRSRPREGPTVPGPPSLRPSTRLVRVACSAGTRPNSTVVSAVSAAAKPSTARSSRTSARWRIDSGAAASSRSSDQMESSTPQTVPASASNALSVRSWRTSRDRGAPSAVRTAISLLRAAPRASIRFATFAQAMSRTSRTAPRSTRSGCRAEPTKRSRSGVSVRCQRTLSG